MGAHEWERSLGMIELRQIRPRLDGVACFAPHWRTAGVMPLHLLAELSVMRIDVASRAGAIFESVWDDFGRVSRGVNLVTFRTGDGQMRARERKAALLVRSNSERRRLKAANRVTCFALFIVGRRRELAIVSVGVTIQAFREGDFVARCSPCRNVAFGARHGCVPSFERILGSRVRLHVEERRLPSFHGMARGTLAVVPAGDELSVVRIGCVAGRALVESDRLFEISGRVALNAINLRMFAEQRKLSLGMIELGARRDFFPSGRRVAGFAGLNECAVMRIGMTIGTLAVGDAGKARGTAGHRR